MSNTALKQNQYPPRKVPTTKASPLNKQETSGSIGSAASAAAGIITVAANSAAANIGFAANATANKVTNAMTNASNNLTKLLGGIPSTIAMDPDDLAAVNNAQSAIVQATVSLGGIVQKSVAQLKRWFVCASIAVILTSIVLSAFVSSVVVRCKTPSDSATLLELSAEDRDFAAYGRYVFKNNHGKDGWWYKQFKEEAPDKRNDETLP